MADNKRKKVTILVPADEFTHVAQRSQRTGRTQAHYIREAVRLILERYQGEGPEQLSLSWDGEPTNGGRRRKLPKMLEEGDPQTVFSAAKAAELVGCTRATVAFAARRGQIRARKDARGTWAITRADLKEWVLTHHTRYASRGDHHAQSVTFETKRLEAFRGLASDLGVSATLLIQEGIPLALAADMTPPLPTPD